MILILDQVTTLQRVTDVIRVAPYNPEPAAIARAADCLRQGGLVAFPTETVYGLGVHALNRDAVQRLFAAKQRPPTDPLIVHIGSIDWLNSIVSMVPENARLLARRFWPGPLTMVLPRSPDVPDEVTAGLSTVAVRVPSHPVARAIIAAAAIPVAAPSANLFSRPSPTQAAHVVNDLGGRIDLIVDGGSTTIGVESTVLDLTRDVPIVLRPGAVTIEALREVLPAVELFPGTAHHEDAARSPGMLAKHYAPRAPLTLYEGESAVVLELLIGAAKAVLRAGRSVGVIASEEERAALDELNSSSDRVFLRVLGPQGSPEVVASALYATMRELDDAGVDVILARGFPEAGLGLAVQDRLRRAAAGRVVRH